MTSALLTTSVGELVATNERRARVFAKYGIDFCCGGKVSLQDICDRKGLDAALLLQEIAEIDALGGPEAPLPETVAGLTEHLVSTHHRYLREEMPRLAHLVNKVARVHGENHPELSQLARVYQNFHVEMIAHMDKEEQVLFPLCDRLEADPQSLTTPVGFALQPIKVMESEHDDAGEQLQQMRDLTNGFAVPSDACASYRAMLQGLLDMEDDTHRHIHKENNILFPKVRVLVEALTVTV